MAIKNDLQPVLLKGATNFRDAGGHPTVDGRRMRTGLVYRSDDLHALKKSDLRQLENLKIRQVIDLRSMAEYQALSDRLPGGSRYLHMPFDLACSDPAEIRRILMSGFIDQEKMQKELMQSYRDIAVQHPADFKTIFEFLSQPDHLPMIIHCTGGKDRTGMTIALIQMVAGVPREKVFENYLYMDPRRTKAFKRLGWLGWAISFFRLAPDSLSFLIEPRREYLQAFFDHIDQIYGSLDNYLLQGLGLSAGQMTTLRQQLTETP